MRVPPNLKYLLFIIGILAAITAAVIFLPRWIPGIGEVAKWVLIGGIGLLVLFTFFKPFLGFLYARADGIFAVYPDENDNGFHVFSYHLSSGGEFGPSDRNVQHYYILYSTGKLFFKNIYSHPMESVAGRSGWEGFDSFEKTILPSKGLQKSMQHFSAKTGTPLKLGKAVHSESDVHYRFEVNGLIIKLKKYGNEVDEGFRITCTDKATNRGIWKKKI